MLRFLVSMLLAWGVSLPAVASPGAGFRAAADSRPPPGAGAGPREVAERFDSLMQAGAPEALAAAQARLAPFLDTTLSRDSVLREETRGDWAVLEVRAEAVFRKPFLGMERMESIQAIHLHRDASGWRIADFEELAEGAHAAPRSGPLVDGAGDSGSLVEGRGEVTALPVSPRAPSSDAMPRVTRMRARVSTRGGDSLFLPKNAPGQSAPGQTVLARAASWAEIETRQPVLPPDTARKPFAAALRPYLASTSELDLSDPLLRKRAAALKKGAADDAEIARRIRLFVTGNFDYKLGAALFGTSREALRDRKGDCSEAAVLVAALLRAAGIPSRVALGYATLGRGVWIGHAWAEAFLGGEWIGVDAALREFPAGANRVALATLSGEREMRVEATNLMIRTLSNLDIEISGAWAGDEAIPLVEHPGAAAESRAFWDKLLEGMEE